MKSLLSIGVFARAAGLSPSALRHYDSIGLLTPAHVDPLTGYRFYAGDQQQLAHLLSQLRQAGASLADMRRVLVAEGPARAELLEELAVARIVSATRAAAILRTAATRFTADQQSAYATVESDIFHKTIEQAWTHCGQEPFDCVFLHITPEGLRCLATDRYRIGDFTALTVTATGRASAILAANAIPLLRRALTSHPGTIAVEMGETLRINGELFPTRSLIDLPDIGHMADTFDEAACSAIPLTRDFLSGGEGPVEIPIRNRRIRLARSYVTDACQMLNADELSLHFPQKPGPVTITSADQNEQRIIIMPLAD